MYNKKSPKTPVVTWICTRATNTPSKVTVGYKIITNYLERKQIDENMKHGSKKRG
jgi:hypothetical protein